MFETKNSSPPKISVTQYKQREILTQQVSNHKRNNSASKRGFWVVIAIVVVLAGITGFLFIRSQMQVRALQKDLAAKEQERQNDPAVKAKEDNKQLVEQVRKLIILPTDEEPTIATVNDLDKLKGQPFFNNAQIGDKVLIYNNAKKAILFRPSENKIIELAPLLTGTSTPAAPENVSNSAQ